MGQAEGKTMRPYNSAKGLDCAEAEAGNKRQIWDICGNEASRIVEWSKSGRRTKSQARSWNSYSDSAWHSEMRSLGGRAVFQRTKETQLGFFFFINWLACWLEPGVSLKCPCGSGMVPSWRLLGAGETLKRRCLGRCKVIRAMKNQDRGSHFLPLLFTSQMWGKQSCPIPYFLTGCAFLP